MESTAKDENKQARNTGASCEWQNGKSSSRHGKEQRTTSASFAGSLKALAPWPQRVPREGAGSWNTSPLPRDVFCETLDMPLS